MNSEFQLKFELQSYWHIGDGRQAGVYADDIVRKNHGLPFIPGTTINGLLKDAFSCAENNLWFAADNRLEQTAITKAFITKALFGEGGTCWENSAGLLQFSNATLSANELVYFANNPEAKTHLYTVLASTAIDDSTGIAKDGALRSIEVTVPMVLCADLSINRQHPRFNEHQSWLAPHFEHWLDLALSLLTGLGAKRSRGFGRVVVTQTPINSKRQGAKA